MAAGRASGGASNSSCTRRRQQSRRRKRQRQHEEGSSSTTTRACVLQGARFSKTSPFWLSRCYRFWLRFSHVFQCPPVETRQISHKRNMFIILCGSYRCLSSLWFYNRWDMLLTTRDALVINESSRFHDKRNTTRTKVERAFAWVLFVLY